MGKHDKAQHFSWSPAPDDFYKARISVLEKENMALHEKVREKDAEIETLREALLNAVTRLGWEMK